MSIYNTGPERSFTCGEAITQYMLVKLNASGNIVKTEGSSGEKPIGIATVSGASGAVISVAMLNCMAVCKGIAAVNNLAINDTLYSAASGRITSVSTSGAAVGIAMEASDTVADIVSFIVSPQVYDAVDAS